jgi:hypothetical protein
MVFKMNRRRSLPLFSLVGLLFFGFVLYLNHSLDDQVSMKTAEISEHDKKQKAGVHNDAAALVAAEPKKAVRINMQNYVPPPPCEGCPGENGAPVLLSVYLLNTLVFIQ